MNNGQPKALYYGHLSGMRSLFALFLSIISTQVMATHIIGGNMYYDHLGGNQYRVTLVLYRDCGPDNANNTGFDAAAQLAVYNAAGQQVTSTDVAYSGEDPVPVELNDPCLTAPPTVCVRTAVYEHVFTLPPIAGGYTISYQRCCRTPAMVNLNGQQGLTCTASIPGPPLSTNSSPRFGDLPAIALCLDQPTTIDFSATDPDGDQLVYGLCAPFIGGTATDPAPFPSAPPYTQVTYAAGYSAAQPVDSDPPMSIDPNTGQLQITPTLQGVFTVGICVTELRDGVVVGETRGDFLFKVVVCDVAVTAVVAEQGEADLCAGLTQAFLNESENASFWSWDFGDAGTLEDTSSAQEPVWTYAQPGIYTVRLIANPGESCADTSYQVYDMQAPMDIFFERPPIRCPGEPAVLAVSGVFGPDADFTWEGAPFGTPGVGTGQQYTLVYSQVGVYPVTLSGISGACADTYVDSVVVMPPPEIGLFNDPEVCLNGAISFSSTSTATTPLSYSWDVGDGNVYTDSTFQHLYSGPGGYSITLTIRTDSGCIAERSLGSQVRIHPNPIAAFTVSPLEVSLLDPEVVVEDHAQDAVEWSYVVEGITIDEPSFGHEFTDGGRRTITQTVVSQFGCMDSTSRIVTVSDHLIYVPNAFTPDGDGVNDTWAPSVRGARLYDLVVMDRWGKEVFRTTNPQEEWSGSGEGEGMYNYVIRLAEFGAFHKEYRGHFTLLR
jgi:gliding motility-associated-like protein